MNLFSSLPFVAEKYEARAVRETIREVMKSHQVDLVQVEGLHMSMYTDEFEDVPKLLVNHNVESVRLLRWWKNERNPVRKAYLWMQWVKLRSFERKAMSGRFEGYVVVSGKDRETLNGMGVRSEIFVIPNGTDTEYFRPTGRPREKDLVLWIGHMDVHTNRDAVLFLWREIYPRLVKRDPAVKVTFVGTSPPQEITDGARKDPRLRTTGFVEDIRPYVEEATVVVVPIRIGGGTRIKILDAMGLGKAVVSTSVGCEGLDVTDGKDILIADDPEEFSARIVDLLRKDELRRGLEGEARRFAVRNDWTRMQAMQETVYRHICSGSERRGWDRASEDGNGGRAV